MKTYFRATEWETALTTGVNSSSKTVMKIDFLGYKIPKHCTSSYFVEKVQLEECLPVASEYSEDLVNYGH